MTLRRKKILKWIALLVALGILALEYGPRLLHPNAYFEGKSATAWLKIARTQSSDEDFLAIQAFEIMGSNAYPTLLAAFLSDAQPSPFTQKLNSWSLKIPVVGHYLYHESRRSLRDTASHIVCRADSGGFTPQLLQLLTSHTNTEFRDLILDTLDSDVPENSDAAMPLASFLTNADRNVKLGVLSILSQMGNLARNAVPALSNTCLDPDLLVRLAAANSLWKVTQQTNVAVPILEAGLSAPYNLSQRYRAAVFLQEIEKKSPAIMDLYIESLTNYSKFDCRTVACQSLKRYGSEAKAAVPSLLILLHDEDADLVKAAKTALQSIDPEALATNSIPQ